MAIEYIKIDDSTFKESEVKTVEKIYGLEFLSREKETLEQDIAELNKTITSYQAEINKIDLLISEAEKLGVTQATKENL